MSRLAGLGIVALLLTSPAIESQQPVTPPRIGGDLNVPKHGLVRIVVEGLDPNAAVIYDVSPEPTGVYESGDTFLFSGPDGTYQVRAIVLKLSAAGRTEKKTLKGVAVIGAPAPVPPGPGPQPPDPPKPEAKVAWAIVIRDAQKVTPEQASLIADRAMWQQLDAAGVEWRVFDDQSPEAVDKYKSAWEGTVEKKGPGVPCLITLGPKLANGKSKILNAVPLPADKAAFLKAVMP